MTSAMQPIPLPWWATAVVYQIYPRSFQDSDGDGIGDLAGILGRLDHLVDLGVDALWISPIFPSPMKDFGYDVADYCGIEPIFGTLEDFDRLVAAVHERGMKLLLDFVPNHTSDQHPWFRESRSSRSSPKRDWYIWRDQPNNWLSELGGSAWEFDAATGQYYYHAFLKEQPDLDWRNPEVVAAMHEVLRFWLRRGVDGFRVDVIWHLAKDPLFRDNPSNPGWQEGRPPHERLLPVHSADQPEVHDVIAGLRRVVDELPDRLLIGEIYLPIERLMAYYGRDLTGTHLPFNFMLLSAPWNARQLARMIGEYEAALPSGGWPNWVLGNHDRTRVRSRVGPAQARVAAMLLLTLRGTPTLYYGDEIGLEQVPIPPERIQDPFEKNVPGIGVGRDGARTPMQWSDAPFAGFSRAEPWLPLAKDWARCNVARLREDPGSLLNLHRRLIGLRRSSAALHAGAYHPVEAAGDLLVFGREAGEERLLVMLNLGDQPSTLEMPVTGRILLSTHDDREGERMSGRWTLRANEGLVVRLG